MYDPPGDTAINGYCMVFIAEVRSGNTSGFQKLSSNLPIAHNPATNPRMTGKVDSHGFDVFVTDVAAAAVKNGVPANLITLLGKMLYGVESQVVQR